MRISDGALRRLRTAAAEPDLSGTRYELQELLGQGGMGAVYLARDRDLDRVIALKVLHVGVLDPAASDRMLREAKILARLEHPGIVPVHDVGVLADGRVYYAMKRVRGQVLGEILASGQPLVTLLRIFERICEAVAFAHAEGILHRDLKPANVMVGSFGEVLVMDWGVAKLLDAPPGGDTPFEEDAPTAVQPPPVADATVTHPGTVLGTPGYMAPEQARGALGEVDVRSDVYALGGILRDVLDASVEHPPRPLLAMRDQALREDPSLRYQSVRELGADVARFLAGQSVSAYRASWLERVASFVHRYRAPILLLVTYLVVRTLLLVFLDV